jgi:nucleotide-binding universal stress UspA family protein
MGRRCRAVPTAWQARKVLGWDVTEAEQVVDVNPVEDGQSYLDGVVRRLEEDRIVAEGRVLVGAAVPSILEYATEETGALIIMCTAGSRGIGARWRVGSVAERIIRQSETPVLLVPPRLAPFLRKEQRYGAVEPAKSMAGV